MNRRSNCAACTWVIMTSLLLFSTLAKSQQFPAGFQATRIAQNLNPTDLKISPNGQFVFVADKSGKIWMAVNDVWRTQPVLDITSQVDPFNERGFNHIALDPDFQANGFIYTFYTTKNQARNRIGRFTFNFTTQTIDPASQQILFTFEPMTADIHTGGAMNFGLDGKLFVATGETSNPAASQNTNSLFGKILRMDKNGGIPTDNPFYNTLTGNSRYIYALGLRNPFTADIQPGTGRYLVCDVGQSAFEEINEILPGKNYGWSLIEGPKPPQITPPDNYQEPFYYYPHSQGCSVIGGVFYNPANNDFPLEYQSKFFFADYCNQTIKVLNVETRQIHNTFATGIGRPVALAIHPNGYLYYLDRGGIPYAGGPGDNTTSNKGVLWKVEYTGSVLPTIAVHPEPVIAAVGDDPVFGVVASGTNLSYQWKRNGVDIPGATAQSFTLIDVQLSDNGARFSCVVTNSHGSVTSNEALLTVTDRTAPEPVITLPADGATYIAGNTLTYSGSATDPVDGAIPASKLTWVIDFHHNDHTHPVLASTSGVTGGSFEISTINEVSDNVWYRIYLTAENSVGMKKTIYRDVHPQKVTLNFEAPPAIALSVDGSSTPTPASILSVKGIVRTIAAPLTYMLADTLFRFQRWGNGSTNPELVFSTPMTDTTIKAVYSKQAVWNGVGLVGNYYNLPGSSEFNGSPAFVRVDPAINFDWLEGSPAPPTIGINQFSVRWTGYVQPRTSGTYTFYVYSDDGARLYVNGQLLINRWNTDWPTELSATIPLTAGMQYNIQLEYFEEYGGARAELRWSGPGVVKQIIPQNALFAESGALPVNFVKFDVRPETNSLLLNWIIEDLGNVKEYVIERSSGGNPFEAIATLPASTDAAYSYRDNSANPNTLYQYRIRQVDFNGRLTYSPVRTGLLSSEGKFDFVISPNPAAPGISAQLVFTQSVSQVTVQVSSADGRVLSTRQFAPAGGQSLNLPLRGLGKGVYFVRVTNEDKTITKRLLVQ